MLKNILLVMLGGGTGAVLRYLLSDFLSNKFKNSYWATFWINISGCFLMGILLELLLSHSQYLYAFFITGLIGSYTTFSTFEYENIDLIAHEKYTEFIKYSIYSCSFAILSIYLGFIIGKYAAIIF